MTELFDDFNKLIKKDLLPILVKYLKDPNNEMSDNINEFLNDQRVLLADLFEKFLKNEDNDINKNIDTNKYKYTDIENITNIDSSSDNEYDDLLKRLILIEENMIQIENILKNKN